MDRRYIFFNTGIGFWSLALVTSFSSFNWTGIFGLLAAGSFLLYALQWKVSKMFKKPVKPVDTETVQTMAPVEKTLPQPEEKISNTVIAREVCFEGNITAVGQVYVYGEVKGNITASEGIVKVMRNGLVHGDINCHELLADGNIQGECKAESIEIGEHAHVRGTLNYATLSVKKGGLFVGNAETTRAPERAANVIGIAPAPAISDKELPPTQKKSKASHA
ncbi:hypothetical protein HA40_02480 [Mixta calida]|nr:hypothetical protein PSNIH2_14640 [Pantoea sp. PSNIH2]ORM62857.1 hypothetical protein HA40_02480 [Mixta calida]